MWRTNRAIIKSYEDIYGSGNIVIFYGKEQSPLIFSDRNIREEASIESDMLPQRGLTTWKPRPLGSRDRPVDHAEAEPACKRGQSMERLSDLPEHCHTFNHIWS